MTDRIEKTIELKAPVSRVWRALTDHREFGTWFGVRVEAPFVVGQVSRGQKVDPCGGNGRLWEAVVQKMEPERLFSFTWHPYADPSEDRSEEPSTLVEFTLQKTPTGTLLRVVESGFDKVSAKRRAVAFPMHEKGWSAQIGNIARHVEQAP